jgi:hypothetical protein
LKTLNNTNFFDFKQILRLVADGDPTIDDPSSIDVIGSHDPAGFYINNQKGLVFKICNIGNNRLKVTNSKLLIMDQPKKIKRNMANQSHLNISLIT